MHAKSSPTKRDATGILTHSNRVPTPLDDVFQTGLLTPQASQDPVQLDAGSSYKRKRSTFTSHGLQDTLEMIERSPNPKSRKQKCIAPTSLDTGESRYILSVGEPRVDSTGNHQRRALNKLTTRLPFGGSSAKVMPPLQRAPISFFDVLVLPLLVPQGLNAVLPFSTSGTVHAPARGYPS